MRFLLRICLSNYALDKQPECGREGEMYEICKKCMKYNERIVDKEIKFKFNALSSQK